MSSDLFSLPRAKRLLPPWKDAFAAWPQTAQRLFLRLMGRRLPPLRDLPQYDLETIALLANETKALPQCRRKQAHLCALLKRAKRHRRIETAERRINAAIDALPPGRSLTIYQLHSETGASLSRASAALESAVSAGVLHRRRMAQSVAVSYIKNHAITQP